MGLSRAGSCLFKEDERSRADQTCSLGQLTLPSKWYDGNVLVRRFFGQDCPLPLRMATP